MKSVYILATLTAITNAWTVEVCTDAADRLGVKDISFPSLILPGGKVEVEVKHIPMEPVSKGSVRIDLLVEGIKVHSELKDICQVVDNCHIAAFHLSTSKFELSLPDHIPAGFKTTLKIVYNDHNGNLLSCVDMHEVNVQRNRVDEKLVFAEKTLGLSLSELDFLFKSWRAERGIAFESSEQIYRKRVFADNLQSVALHNLGKHSYSKAMNHFGALTPDEFKQSYFGYNGPQRVNRTSFQVDDNLLSRSLSDIPESIDWVAKGAVTPVKNQGACGSCWAFSTTGALEGAYFVKNGKLLSFSEQDLVSCDKTDQGCNGGLMDNGFAFIQRNGGLCLEADFPYIASAGVCKKCQVVPGSAPKSVHDLEHTEQAMKEALSKQPVAIAIEADQMSFQFYSKGVLTGNCGQNLDHGVLAVGYGTLNGVPYWKVKNSWGGQWGMNGYINLQRGKSVTGGQCGLLLSASYPEL